MPDPTSHLIVSFRKWFDEVVKKLISVDQADYTTTTKAVNGMTKEEMDRTVRDALAVHMSETNPHKDSALTLNLISKAEWEVMKDNLVDLMTVPIASIPKVEVVVEGTTLLIPEIVLLFRGRYYTVPPTSIQVVSGTLNLGIVVTPDGSGEFTFSHRYTANGVTVPGGGVYLIYGKVIYTTTTPVTLTVTTESSNFIGDTTIGYRRTGRRIPTGSPTVSPAATSSVPWEWRTV